jgi:hypothetical protein
MGWQPTMFEQLEDHRAGREQLALLKTAERETREDLFNKIKSSINALMETPETEPQRDRNNGRNSALRAIERIERDMMRKG